MTDLPPAQGQPPERGINTWYSGKDACPGRESFRGGGWGRGPSGRRRGRGPPCRRRVAGLRDRPATLGLRYGPDSYGRQQWGILRNGGNPDAATPRAGRRRPRRKPLSAGNTSTRVPAEEAPAKYVPAAAVIRMGRALSGFIGRKARVGGALSGTSNPRAQPPAGSRTGALECGRGERNSRCSGGMRRYREEHRRRRQLSGPKLTLRRESWGSEQD